MIWKQTYTGRVVDMLDPTAEMIDFRDVAHSLASIARFDGHTFTPYAVGQHCVMGADAVLAETGSYRLAGLFLLHDAHEAYVGDTGTPTQQALGALCPGAIEALKTVRRRFDVAIHGAARIAVPTAEESAVVKEMDIRMLRAERDSMMEGKPQDWHESVENARDVPSLPIVIEPWSFVKTRRAYLHRLREWCPMARAAA